MSIRLKIVLLAGPCLVAVVATVVGMNLYQSRQNNQLVSDSSERMLTSSVEQAGEQGQVMHFQMTGTIAGATVDEGFDLPSDLAFNFASGIERVARQHGLPATQVIALHLHHQYDAMFSDIQQSLGWQSGDSLAPEHLGRA